MFDPRDQEKYDPSAQRPPKPQVEAALAEQSGSTLPPTLASTLPDIPFAGTRFGGFTSVRRIGFGSTGNVLLAEPDAASPHAIHQQVAIKVLRNSPSLWKNPGVDSLMAMRQLIHEACICASIPAHPNVVSFIELGTTEDGHIYFAYKYVEGSSMAKEMTTSPLMPLLNGILGALRGLAHTHRAKVLHRDLKPGNILLPGGVLADYGLAQKIGEIGDPPAAVAKVLEMHELFKRETPPVNSFVGTMAYTSPEQAIGSDVLTESSDIFPIGIMLYEVLTGTYPFGSKLAPAEQLREGLLSITPRDPLELNPACPPGLAAVAIRALNKVPALRYQCADEMADDLSRESANFC